MKIPSKERLMEMFEKYKVPSNIKLHCMKVRDVAGFLAKRLKEKGEDIDVELVEALGLSHDMLKVISLKTLHEQPEFKAPKPTQEQIDMQAKLKKKYGGLHETKATYDIFKEDYPEFAKEVLIEGMYPNECEEQGIKTKLEHRLLRYVDLIIHVDEIIPIKKRIVEVEKRYSDLTDENKGWISKKEEAFKTQKEIFEKIGTDPEQLKEMI